MTEWEKGLQDYSLSCTRHDSEGHDDRVHSTYLYALGLTGGGAAAVELASAVISLHDHKGDLHVTWAAGAEVGPGFQKVIRQAWEEMAYELGENVHFECFGTELHR